MTKVKAGGDRQLGASLPAAPCPPDREILIAIDRVPLEDGLRRDGESTPPPVIARSRRGRGNPVLSGVSGRES